MVCTAFDIYSNLLPWLMIINAADTVAAAEIVYVITMIIQNLTTCIP